MKIPQIPIVIILLISVCCNVYAKKTEWNVFDFGALGNGITLDTQAIQTAIDECHKAGGGKVCLSNGCFLSGTLYMKDNVELHIETGAKLLGSRHAKDYESIPSSENSITAQSYNSGKALIYGENLTDIAITGNGIIDGNGDKLILEQKTRAHLLHFKSCNYVKVKDITLRNGSWWIQKYHLCNHVLINGVTVYSKENQNMNRPRYADTPGRNTDGCNIVDSKNVQISDCNIFSGDDTDERSIFEYSIKTYGYSYGYRGMLSVFKDVTGRNTGTRNEKGASVTWEGREYFMTDYEQYIKRVGSKWLNADGTNNLKVIII